MPALPSLYAAPSSSVRWRAVSGFGTRREASSLSVESVEAEGFGCQHGAIALDQIQVERVHEHAFVFCVELLDELAAMVADE